MPNPLGGFGSCSVSILAAKLGEQRGSTNLCLSAGGLGGGLEASFCPVTGCCQSLSNGRVALIPEPEACVTVRVLNEKVYTPF